MKKADLYKHKALRYMDDVLSGRRVAGELERLAVERQVRDMEMAMEKGIWFDEKAAKRAMVFFTMLRHYKGEWAGQELELEDWQCFILWCVFGWKTKGGRRRFTYANVEVARKNGKTTFAAGVALYMLTLDGESGAEIYSAAVDKAQASICWDAAKHMVEQSPQLKRIITLWKTSIVYEAAASSYKPLSKETKNKDGLSPHCAVCDEMHAWPTDDLYHLITTGMGARRQPLVFSITTAGSNMTLPYYRMRSFYIDILRGIKQQDNTFCIIYCPDKDDDWHDRTAWLKANPNYGVSVYGDYMESEFAKAMNQGSTTEVNFKTKNLNMWVDAPDVWIRDDLVAKCDYGHTPSELEGQPCYGGLDLASHVDINALALYFPEMDPPTWHFYFWIPEDKVREKEDRVDYREWQRRGYIRVTNGNVIDIDEMVRDVAGILRQYDCRRMAFDPAKAYHGVIQGLQKEGFDDIFDEYSQGILSMSEPTKRIEADISSAAVDLMRNPVIRWMFRNVVIYRDSNDNIKMDKKRSIEKIDGCVAMAMAIGGFMSDEDNYTDLGPVYLNL